MIRKQILLEERQSMALKRLAEKTGKSEGALMREAVEMRLAQDDGAEARWEGLLRRWASGPAAGHPRTWRREDLYEDRVSRVDRDPR